MDGAKLWWAIGLICERTRKHPLWSRWKTQVESEMKHEKQNVKKIFVWRFCQSGTPQPFQVLLVTFLTKKMCGNNRLGKQTVVIIRMVGRSCFMYAYLEFGRMIFLLERAAGGHLLLLHGPQVADINQHFKISQLSFSAAIFSCWLSITTHWLNKML